MIQHKADRREVERLAIIGAGTLFHFRESGNPVTCEWAKGKPVEHDDTVATFKADGVKDQTANWRGMAMLAKMGWRESDPSLDWENMSAEWHGDVLILEAKTKEQNQ